HAAADDDDLAADWQRGQILRLAQGFDVLDGVVHAGHSAVFDAQSVHARESDAEEDRIVIAAQLRERNVAPEDFAGLHLDVADRQQIVDFMLRDTARDRVSGNAVLVESAEFGARVVHRDLVTQRRQPVSAGQSGRPAADYRDVFAAGGADLEQLHAG